MIRFFEKFTTSFKEVTDTMKRLREAGYGDVDWQRTRHGFKVWGYLR